MNGKIPVLATLAVVLGTTVIRAEPSMVDRLIDLRRKRDQAVERALAPIDATYRRELEKLLSEAVADGDRENVDRIRAEMATIDAGGAGAAVATADGEEPAGDAAKLERLLLKERWSWWAGKNGGPPQAYADFGFNKDGSLEVPASIGFLKSWKVVDGNHFEVALSPDRKWLFEYDPKTKAGESIKRPGYIGDAKRVVMID